MNRLISIAGMWLVFAVLSFAQAADTSHYLVQVRLGTDSLEILDNWQKKGPVREKKQVIHSKASHRLVLLDDAGKQRWSRRLDDPFRVRVPLPENSEQKHVSSVPIETSVLLIRLPESAVPGWLVFEKAKDSDDETPVSYVEVARVHVDASLLKQKTDE